MAEHCQIHSLDRSSTLSIGCRLAAVLAPGDVVLLSGQLGAGKTVLTKGIAQGLGVTATITSPTFTLVRPYRTGAQAAARGISQLLHADCFRLESFDSIADIVLGELVDEGTVSVVEWGEMAAPLVADALHITLTHGSESLDDHREVVAEWSGPHWQARSEQLYAALMSP